MIPPHPPSLPQPLPGPAQAAEKIRAGTVQIDALLEQQLHTIAQLNPRLGAFIEVFGQAARAEAATLAAEAAAGHWRGPLHGVAVGVKDIIDVAGSPTTCHSRLMEHAPPAAQDAPVIARLRAAGAIILGKTALHEFATGGPSFDLPWPPARNPWNPDHHPGGSSSGSAVAVAAGMVGLGLGTDTAGSVRHPASACGILGLKPTRDAISCDGVFPLSRSLDHVGLLARSAADIALAFDVLRDPHLPQAIAAGPVLPQIRAMAPISGLRVGIIDGWDAGAAPEIRAAFATALGVLRDLGAVMHQIALPRLEDFTTCGRMILQAEAHTLHRTWLASRAQDYGARGRARLSAGQAILAADYIAAQHQRMALTKALHHAMADVDVLVTVSSLIQPCRIDDEAAIAATYDQQARTPFNVTGSPALSVPIGLCPQGLPIGMQIIGNDHDEATLLRVAAAYGAAQPAPHPPLSHLLPTEPLP
jgi:aspartyl-tRNA(Asn)/glutamyl-tRNA(Gln) amidotransferase subunit A